MSEFGLVAYILLIFGIASFLAMREKVLPLNQASAVKNLILVILGEPFINVYNRIFRTINILALFSP